MLPALALALLGAAGPGWTAAVSAEGRSRTELGAEGRDALAEETLHADLGASARLLDLDSSLSYRPDLLVDQAVSGSPLTAGPTMHHAGTVGFAARVAPGLRLRSNTSVDWGLTDFSILSAAPAAGGAAGTPAPPQGGPLPAQRFVRTLGIASDLALTWEATHLLLVSADVGMQRSGGATHDAVGLIPVQAGPQASASAQWVASRTSTFGISGNASDHRFGNGERSDLGSLQGTWSLRLSRELRGAASAGASWTRATGPVPVNSQLSGVVSADLGMDQPLGPESGLHTAVGGSLLPGVNPFTGRPMQNLRGHGDAAISAGKIGVSLSASGGSTVAGSGAGTSDARIGLSFYAAIDRRVSLLASAAGAWTNQEPYAGWTSQVSVGLRWGDAGVW